MNPWQCTECGYVSESERPPLKCPECGVSGDRFEVKDDATGDWSDEPDWYEEEDEGDEERE